MKILGIGVDIIKNNRFKSLIQKKNFITKNYGLKEIKSSKKISNKTNYFAKRFAAKEALAKSFGTGFRNNLSLRDIEILNDDKGKPYYLKSKKINEIIYRRFHIRKYDLFLSISDEKDHSIAFTILQAK